jgi:predicted aspartyl protease
LKYLAHEQGYPFRTPVLTSEIEIFPRSSVRRGDGMKTSAVWDTGATKTFINRQLSEKLSLMPIEFQLVVGANGTQMAGLVDLAIKLPNGLFIPDKRAFICELPDSINILIGMDIIQLGDFHISNTAGKTRFSFVIPSLPTSFSLAEEADKLNG